MNPIEMPIEHKADGPKCYAEYVKRYLNFALNDLEGRFRLAQEGTTEKCEKLDENDWGGLEIVERQHPGPNERYVYLKANDPVDYWSREFYRLGIKAVIKEWVG